MKLVRPKKHQLSAAQLKLDYVDTIIIQDIEYKLHKPCKNYAITSTCQNTGKVTHKNFSNLSAAYLMINRLAAVIND